MITPPIALAAVIASAAFLAFWLERRFAPLAKVGSALIALLLGAGLSNTGVVPADSPVYDTISGPVTLLAIAWLLLAVDLRDLRLAGPRMLAAFALALAGTVMGAFLAALIFAGPLGEDGWRLAGTITGTYSGGSLNFTAVGRALELPAPLFLGANAADAMLTGLWLGATIALPGLLGRYYRGGSRHSGGGSRHYRGGSPPKPVAPGAGAVATRDGFGISTEERPTRDAAERPARDAAPHPFFAPTRLSSHDLARIAALGVALVALAELIQTGFNTLPGDTWLLGVLRSVPVVVWLSSFALLVGHLPWTRRPPGAMVLGSLALHLFFVVIGVWSRVEEIVAVGPAVFFYIALVVAIHGVVVYGGGWLARLDIASISVGSQAAVGGPASALAVAVARGWPALILPGIAVGLLGYALGTYLGLGVALLVRTLT